MIRFLIRFLALTGLLLAAAAAIGLVSQRADWNLTAEMAGEQGQTTQVLAIVLTSGFAAAVIGLIIEVLSGAQISAGRRSALGANVIAQVLLALVLVAGVNVWSFMHYHRWDCTRDS